MGAPDFIADADFKPDGSPDPASGPGASSGSSADFIPDAQFESDEDKYGGPTGALTAGALHVVNTALPYVGPKIENAIGIPNEEIEGLTREHPLASAAGDVGGFIGGAKTLGAFGAPGAIQAAGEVAAEPFAAGSLAGRVAQFGTEGALIAGANSANDLALGNPNLTAQKVLSDVGMGFALGSGLGVLSKSVETVVPKAVAKLGSALDSLKETALGTAEEPSLFVKAASLPGGVASGQAPNDWAQAFYHGLNAPEASVSIRDLTKNLEQIADSGNESINALRESMEDLPNAAKDPIPNFPRPGTPLLPEKEGEAVALQLLESHEAALKDFRSGFMRKTGSDEWAIDPAKVQSFFKRFGDPSQDLRKDSLNTFINSALDLSKASENFYGYKAAEESLSSHISELAKKNQELSEIAKAMQGKVKGSVAGGLLNDAALGYAAHAIGIPNPVTGAALGMLETYRAIKNPYELGGTLSHSVEKLKVLANIADTVGKRIGSLAKGIFSAESTGALATAGAGFESARTYTKATKRVQELMANQGQLMDHVAKNTDNLYEAAPHVSQSLHQTMINGVQFLDSKIPRPSSQLPLSSPWEPSVSQKADFNRYYRAVNDPVAVLKDVKDGTLSRQSIEALQIVHPELLSEMRQRVIENLNPKKAVNLPYATRVALSKFMGEPLDESMVPKVLASNQLALQMPPLATQSQPRAPRSTVGGLKELNIAKRSNLRDREKD